MKPNNSLKFLKYHRFFESKCFQIPRTCSFFASEFFQIPKTNGHYKNEMPKLVVIRQVKILDLSRTNGQPTGSMPFVSIL